MKLTEHFTLEELVRSSKAEEMKVNNMEGVSIDKLKKVADLLEVIRAAFGAPIWVSSGYRCKKVNDAVGGSKTSQHLLCEAADIKACKGHTNKELFEKIKSLISSKKIEVGQLIWEYGTKENPAWVHVSLKRTNGKPNNQILTIGVK